VLIDVINSYSGGMQNGKMPVYKNEEFVAGPEYDNGRLTINELKLLTGAIVRYIHNNGLAVGNAEQTLVTKRYVDGYNPGVTIVDAFVITSMNPGTITPGTTVDDQTVTAGQVFLLRNTENPNQTGIYVCKEEGSELIPDYNPNQKNSVIVLNPKVISEEPLVVRESKLTVQKNQIVTGYIQSENISGFIRTASIMTILNL